MKLSKKHYAGIVAILLVLGFIFINSMMNGVISQWISALPKKFVQLFIPYGKYKWLDNFLINEIRKFAHFLEYCLLGILVTKFYYNKKHDFQRLINAICILFSVAFLDETIQIFSNRQSKISDIWIDLFGGICGIIIYTLCRCLKEKVKENKNRSEK